MKNFTSAEEAIKQVKSGDSVMIGGFLAGGNPGLLVQALTDSAANELTIISTDSGTTEMSRYNLSRSGKIKKIYASYIGANPETGRLYMSGEAEVELVPQGTLAERIRAGGAGLGGFLTPTGVGTIVEEGKQKMTIEGKDYLLEMPLRANVALIKANIADKAGNLYIKGSSKNFNTVMATAADHVIVEAGTVVEIGEINPEQITVPGIFVDTIVEVNN